jgi:hypothetical protein
VRCRILISAVAAGAAGYLAARRGRAPAAAPPHAPADLPEEVRLAQAESAAVLVEWEPVADEGAPPAEPGPEELVVPEPDAPAAADAEPEVLWIALEPDPVPAPAQPVEVDAAWAAWAPDPAPPVPAADPGPVPGGVAEVVRAEGRFWIGGMAVATGHPAVAGVSFRAPLDPPPGPGQVRIEVDSSQNVPDHGLILLRDEGFAPDREGFTLMLAAAGPGPFSAAGRFVVGGS